MRRNHQLFWAIVLLSFCILMGIVVEMHRVNDGIGREVGSYKRVPVYQNGKQIEQSHGRNYGVDGYYYGEKWQCVEYVKRFYYLVKDHKMPDVMGNARDFYDPSVSQGKLNKQRGLIQYRNGGNVKPKIDDILVFTDTKYGHVAIVTDVGSDYIEVIQQNVNGQVRQKIRLTKKKSNYYVGTTRKPSAWLRKE